MVVAECLTSRNIPAEHSAQYRSRITPRQGVVGDLGYTKSSEHPATVATPRRGNEDRRQLGTELQGLQLLFLVGAMRTRELPQGRVKVTDCLDR